MTYSIVTQENLFIQAIADDFVSEVDSSDLFDISNHTEDNDNLEQIELENSSAFSRFEHNQIFDYARFVGSDRNSFTAPEVNYNDSLLPPLYVTQDEQNFTDRDERNLLSVEEDFLVEDSNDSSIQQLNPGDNPAFDLIGLTQLRNDDQFAGIDGSGFAVAVIDTGINYNHSLLAPNYITGDDFVNPDNDPFDDEGHGTHVAGTVGATDETIGVAPDVDIIGLKVLDNEGSGNVANINQALQWVLDNHEEHNIVAVNMSLGGGFYASENEVSRDPRVDLVNRLEREGVTVVSATGNSYYQDQTLNAGAPAIYSTLAVGAVWQETDQVASFSQRINTDNFIFAPGAEITSTSINGELEDKRGTSMASPHVAGAVALLQEAAFQFGGRLLTPDEVVEILRSTADIIRDGDDEVDNVVNTGLSFPRLNIYNAIVELRNRFDGIAPPPPDNDPEQPIANDPNGTILGAYVGPNLDGEPVGAISGIIGIDGNGTNIGDKDVDIFRFEVDSQGIVTIELGTNTDDPDDFDTYLRLFNEDGTEIAFNDDIVLGVEQFSRIETELAPGTYYAGVSGYNNDSYDPNVAGSGIAGDTGNYSLQLSLTNNDPNGLISGAVEVTLGNDIEPLLFHGFIGADYGEPVGTADVDLFRIVVPDNGVLFIDTDTPYNEGEYVDSFLRLFNEEGEELFFTSTGEPAESDDELSFNAQGEFTEFLIDNDIVVEDPAQTTFTNGSFDADDNYIKGNYGHRTDSFLGVNVDRGEVYYVGVSDFDNQDYDPANLNNRQETGTGGLYELIVTFANNDINGSISQITSSTNLPLLSSQQNIGLDDGIDVGDRDVDFWKFNSPESGILEIDIDSTETDTVALLFDGEGRLLAENDDNNDDNDDNGKLDPLLRYQIDSNTDYFVAITGYGNQNFDPFGLGSGSGGETGEYTINASLLDSDQFDSFTDNSVGSELVQNISLETTIAGNIGEDNGFVIGAEDIDLYRFVPDNDAVINIRVSANEEFSADTFLRLFDAEGNEIAFNDNETNLTRGSFLRQEVIANTEYIIGINGTSNNAQDYNPLTGEGAAAGSRGDYDLFVEVEPDPALLVAEADFLQNPAQYMNLIRDFDGNDLGDFDSWKKIGSIDIQGDGDNEHIFVNPVNGRWATVGADITGTIDFSNHGQGGDTRVVGIYADPLVEAGIVEKDSDFDSQRRFQNDLFIDNLELIEGSGFDYDGDNLLEMYLRVNDGTAVLHSYMHADGNIRYANYQSQSDLEQFMTANGIDSSVWGDWFSD